MKMNLSNIKFSPEIVKMILQDEGFEVFLDYECQERVEREFNYLGHHLKQGKRIYGVNTGFGKNVDSLLDVDEMSCLQENLTSYLDCGLGEYEDYSYSRLTFLARLKHIVSGETAVSLECCLYLIELFNRGVAPLNPKLGSLGASGDLVTMAPLASLLVNKDSVCWYKSETVKLQQVYDDELPGFRGRDALALMNGLSNVSAIAAIELEKCRNLLNTALASIALCKSCTTHENKSLSPVINDAPVRNFDGQTKVAAYLAKHCFERKCGAHDQFMIQDEYSLRCLPQYLGPLYEMFRQVESWVYSELNSQSDNPKVTENDVYSGGNFYGGYLALASDQLAVLMTKVSELLDRQTFHLVSGTKGLPQNLINQKRGEYLHGLKGVHQVSNSLFMKILPQATSYSLSTRSTESHNQDVVSNCSNAWQRIKDLRNDFSYIITCHLVLSCQALDLVSYQSLDKSLVELYEKVRESVPFVSQDVSLREGLNHLKVSIDGVRILPGLFS